MMKKERLFALILSLALGAGLLSGCSGGDSSSGGSSTGSSSSGASSSEGTENSGPEPMDLSAVTDPYLATAGVAGDTVVATTGEYEIPAADYLYWLNRAAESYLSQISAFGLTELPWDMEMGEGVTLESMVVQTALETAALFRLMPELGAAEGLSISQEALDEMNGQLAELGAEGQEREHRLWYQMMTSELYARLYQQLEFYAQLQELYYGQNSEDYPTDAEVLAYAQDQMGVYRAKHILLLTKDLSQTVTNEDGTTGYAPLDDAVIAEKRALADELLAQLRAAEDPIALFDELMNQYSEDSGLAANPDGYTTYKGYMVSEFEETALALKDGEISDVVESVYGYHIILRLPLDPADYRADMVAGLMEERANQWLAENAIQTNETFDRISPPEYLEQVLSLQTAVAEEVNAGQEEGVDSASGSEG